MSVDPTNITNYHLSENELQEVVLFWILAAGKNGVTAAKCLDKLLTAWRIILDSQRSWRVLDSQLSPFDIIKEIDRQGILPDELKKFGIGCYRRKAEYFRSLILANLNLKTCSIEELEAVKGCGKKTSRCFLIHSRPNQFYAGLDRHALSFLRDMGYDVPKSTPTGKKYKELEKAFLHYVKESGKTVAEFDLVNWLKYRDKG